MLIVVTFYMYFQWGKRVSLSVTGDCLSVGIMVTLTISNEEALRSSVMWPVDSQLTAWSVVHRLGFTTEEGKSNLPNVLMCIFYIQFSFLALTCQHSRLKVLKAAPINWLYQSFNFPLQPQNHCFFFSNYGPLQNSKLSQSAEA